MKQHSVWCATALASRVFPVPGGPYSRTPCGGREVGKRREKEREREGRWVGKHGRMGRKEREEGNNERRMKDEETQLGCPTHLGLCYAEALKQLRVLHWQLYHLLYLLDLLVQSSNHVIGRVGHLFHHHQTDQRVHLGEEERGRGRERGLEL